MACAVIVLWAVTGPVFHYSDTWQLIINTGTTIVTFLMVFLIQNTQNRDSAVLHLKLDELIRVSETARNNLLDLEGLTEEELKRLKGSFTKLAGGGPAPVRRNTDAELWPFHVAQDSIESLLVGVVRLRREPARRGFEHESGDFRLMSRKRAKTDLRRSMDGLAVVGDDYAPDRAADLPARHQ